MTEVAEAEPQLDSLQERIGVRFRRIELLREAMTHASWNNERGRPSGPGHDNERLEYLGDAVLELVVGEYLFKRFPGYDEGQLTQLRAALVNTLTLARLAERLDLGGSLFVGKGAAKTGAHKLPSLLANAFEAMIGAIFLDQGYRVATRVFLQNIGDLAEWSDENFKGRLQEVAQDRTGTTPTYRVLATGGPGHKREYTADAVVGGEVVGSGRGGTKQAAEQSAARAALQTLTRQPKRRTAKSPATRAAGAARDAARDGAAAPVRVRRSVAEVAAERSEAARERRPRPAAAPAPSATVPPAAQVTPQRRRGLLSALRSAAEALVGRVVPPEPSVGERPPRRELPRAVADGVPWPPVVGGEAGPAGRGGGRGAGRPGAAAGGARATAPAGGGPSTQAGQRRGQTAGGPSTPAGQRRGQTAGTEAPSGSGRSRRGGTAARGGQAASGGAPSGRARSGDSAPTAPDGQGQPARQPRPRTRRPSPASASAAAAAAEPAAPPPAGATDDAPAEARRPSRRGRRGGRGRRRPGTAAGADEQPQP